jgi:hypothetical protein
MPERAYVDFDITIRRLPSGSYKVVASSPGGDAEADFNVPFDGSERDKLREILQGPVREFGEGGLRKGDPVDYWEQVKKRGEQLYDALFADEVGEKFTSRRDWALEQPDPHGVRIRIHLDEAPELADLPWEYLYDSGRQMFLVLRDFTPIVRHLNQGDPAQRPLVKPPINMLVMISKGNPPLDVEAEWKKISDKLAPLQEKQLVSLTRVPAATVGDLQDCLNTKKAYHIFHFIGHSGFQNKVPVLQLDDGQKMTADALATHLDPSSFRLVVLNSCDGARAAAEDSFSALAHCLVKIGIPAVVAMQFKITDGAAIEFARGLYGGIANNLPVEACVTMGRMAIYGRDNNPTEWGTPVLFMRGQNGRLFSLDIPSEQQARQRQIDALAKHARLAIDEKQYDMAIQQLQKIKELLAAMFAAGP